MRHGRGHRLAGAYARGIVALRPAIVVAWLAATAAALAFLPGLGSSSTAPIGDIVPTDAQALVAQQRGLELFGATPATDTVLVQRNPQGLTADEVAAHVQGAAAVAAHRAPEGLKDVRAAIPLVNVPLPGVRWGERSTTALTYLFLGPDLNLLERDEVARRYVADVLRPAAGSTVGVTGAGPARLQQFKEIDDVLPWIEIATVLVVLVIVAVYFRSIGAPLVTLATAAIAYVIAVRVMAWAGEQAGEQVPSEIEPVLVVLLLGLVTDYTIFFMSDARQRLRQGEARLDAARLATARIAPIVLVAGILVTAGAASLLAGKMDFFRVFGPGLALAALVVTIVCVTLVPAVLALIGPRLFRREAGDEPPPKASRPMRLMTAKPIALLLAVACVAALVVAALGVRRADLSVGFIPSLPAGNEARQAGDAAAHGFVDGVLSPTDVILEQPGVGGQRPQLARLQDLIARQRGVAAVLGPGQPITEPLLRYVVAPNGAAARFVVVLDHEPTGAPAIETFRSLRDRMPTLIRQAGLAPGARVSYGGETALSAETVDALVDDLWRVGVVTAVVMLVLLALFLRALLAPLLLVAGSILAVGAAMGLTSLLAPELIGTNELVYYVPLVAAVLLVGLGSDYNVLIAGRIREEAHRRGTRDAIAVGAPAASRAVTVAGITLASTFALLAIVPLRPFRELALLMTIGVLLDALVVRTLLIPSLLAVAGRRAWWPSRPGAGQDEEDGEVDDGDDGERPRTGAAPWRAGPVRG